MPSPHRISFLLLPRASMSSIGGALAALEAANALAREDAWEQPAFEITLCRPAQSPRDKEIGLADSVLVASDGVASHAYDTLVVVADNPLPETGHDEVLSLLREASAQGKRIGGIGSAPWLLARCGVLDGYRATIHWPYSGMFAERFPNIHAGAQLYVLDRQRLTCAGGLAALDAMLALIAELFGNDVQADVLEQLGIERVREGAERQRVPITARIGGGQPKLTEAVALMEANFQEPLPTEEIARLVGVSRRQLERLFKQHLNSLPSRYYLEMRLTRARQLLRETSQSILQIGLSCGFSSGPHFSSAYRAHFGVTPRDERSKRLSASSGAAT